MSNHIPTSFEIDPDDPDHVHPWSLGAERSDNSLSFISDVQSAIARIEQRLAQSTSQLSTTVSAFSSTPAAALAAPTVLPSGITVSTLSRTPAATLVTEKVELFERSGAPAVPNPNLSRDVDFTTPPLPLPSPSASCTAQSHLQQSQSVHERVSSPSSGMNTSPNEKQSGATSKQTLAAPTNFSSSIAAVIERFENVIQPEITSQGQFQLEAKPIAPTVQHFEAEVTTDTPRSELSHIGVTPIVRAVDHFEASVPTKSPTLRVAQVRSASVGDTSRQSESSQSSAAPKNMPLDLASSSVAPVVEKIESQVEVTVPGTEQIHTGQVHVAAFVEQSELISTTKPVTSSTTGSSVTPATSPVEKVDNRVRLIVENEPVESDMEVPSITQSVNMLEDQPQAIISSVQTNLNNVSALDTIKTTNTTTSQHAALFADVAPVQAVSSTEELVREIATESARISIPSTSEGKDADTSTDPPSDTEQSEMESDNRVSTAQYPEAFPKPQNNVCCEAFESDPVSDRARSADSDQSIRKTSAVTSMRDNTQAVLPLSNEEECVASGTSLGLPDEGTPLGKVDENMGASYLNQCAQDLCSNLLNDETSNVLKIDSTLVETNGSDKVEITTSVDETEHERTICTSPDSDLRQRADLSSNISTHTGERAKTEEANAPVRLSRAGPLSIRPGGTQRPPSRVISVTDNTMLPRKLNEAGGDNSSHKQDAALASIPLASEISDVVITDTEDKKEVAGFTRTEDANSLGAVHVLSEVEDNATSKTQIRFTDVFAEAESLVAAEFKDDLNVVEANATNFSQLKVPTVLGTSVNDSTLEAGLSSEETRFLAALDAEIARQGKLEGSPDAIQTTALAERGTQRLQLTVGLGVGNEDGQSASGHIISTGEKNVTKQSVTQRTAPVLLGGETIFDNSFEALSYSSVAEISAEESQATKQNVFQNQEISSTLSKKGKSTIVKNQKVGSVVTPAVAYNVFPSPLTDTSHRITPLRDTVQSTNKNKELAFTESQLSASNTESTTSSKTKTEPDRMVAAGSVYTVPRQEGVEVHMASQTRVDGESTTSTIENVNGKRVSKDNTLMQLSMPTRHQLEATGSPMTPNMEENRRVPREKKQIQRVKIADSCQSSSRNQVSRSLARQAKPTTTSTLVVQSRRASQPSSWRSFERRNSTQASSMTNTQSKISMNSPRARGSRPDGSPLPSGRPSARTPGSGGQTRQTIILLPNEQLTVADRLAPRSARIRELKENEGKDRKVSRSRLLRGSTFAGAVPRARTVRSATNLGHNAPTDITTSPSTPPVRPLSPNLSSASAPVGENSPTADNHILRRTLSFSHLRRMTAPSLNISHSPLPRAPFGSNSGRTRQMNPFSSPSANRLERRATMSMAVVSSPRLSRSFPRHRPTVPQPFDLVGLELHERAQQMIEEARRRADENERRRRAFRARPMPDFSNPIPKPKK